MARKILQGKVVSDKMVKTRVVEIERVFAHPKYQKVMRRTTKVHVHDENNASRAGDYVTISETKPLSKTKRWEVLSVTKSAGAAARTSSGGAASAPKEK
ncbi:MAG: 30S ribosomal protein S17 [Endomicrobiia bacterium]|nr:30S ribosomal protein S17 [Endomicrobiia bacterium]